MIFERTNKDFSGRSSVYSLIDQSYKGGKGYVNSANLDQYSRESTEDYQRRLKRSLYLNYIKPLCNMLVGLLYSEQPKRTSGAVTTELLKKAQGRASMDSVMPMVASMSLRYPIGILVDSPEFDSEEIRTESDRRKADLQPFIVTYHPSLICDYYVSQETGKFLWVLLDDSYVDNTDPLVPERTVKRRTLWTPEFIRRYEIKTDDNGKASETIVREKPNPVGEVPFFVLSWVESDLWSPSDEVMMEDPALISRKIFNYLSVGDEGLYSGTFHTLMFPIGSQAASDAADRLEKEGIGNMSMIRYVPTENSPNPPTWSSPEIRYLDYLENKEKSLRKEILAQFGLDRDEEKVGVQSGNAKLIEFRKTTSILATAARQMEKAEREIARLLHLWFDGKEPDFSVEYSTNYDPSIIYERVKALWDLYDSQAPEAFRKAMLKQVVRELPGIPDDERQVILTAIDSSEIIDPLQSLLRQQTA